jgi:hypothetical protein
VRVSYLGLALSLAFVAVGLSACTVSIGTTTTNKIDRTKAERFLISTIHPAPRSAACPSSVTAVKGGTFICNVIYADGVPGIVVVHMTNASGGVTVDNADIRLADVVPSKADAFLMANIAPKPKSVTCPSGVKIVKGGAFDCDVVLADGAHAVVTVHMIDAIGGVSIGTKDVHLRR